MSHATPSAMISGPSGQPLGVAASAMVEWRSWLLTMSLVATLYLLCANPYWVPGGDSELYIAIARNLATGEGYLFNGQPVGMVPPGWPALLAGGMWLTSSFALLKLLPLTLMLVFFSSAYWICRRFTTRFKSGLVIFLTALLSYCVPLAFWFHSDASFAAFSTLALLLSFQIKEGRSSWWRIMLMAVLCALSGAMRWISPLTCGLCAMVLLQGELRPRFNRQWIAAGVSFALTAVVFIGLRQLTQVSEAELQQSTTVFGGTGESTELPTISSTDASIAPRADSTVSRNYDLVATTTGVKGYALRILFAGHWFCYLFYQPFRAAESIAPASAFGALVGWLALGLLIGWAVVRARQREWIWIGLIGYCAILILIWEVVNARYLVPVAFLLILGVMLALESLVRTNKKVLRLLARGLLATFIATLLLCNGLIWGVEMHVARSDRFYDRYEAGTNKDLIAICHYLIERKATGYIAVDPTYANLGKTKDSVFGLRAVTMLTGQPVITPRKKNDRRPETGRTARWARENGVTYFISQRPVSPWRVWHFRAEGFQKRKTGQDDIRQEETMWVLYELSEDRQSFKRVIVDTSLSQDWPRHVPGL